MDQPHPFSPPQPFPLSFFEEDMLLFTGSTHGSHDLAAAWADMGIGQGRSVSSIMDPYHLDLQGAAGTASPVLQSPLMDTGFSSGGGGGPRTRGGSGNKKRGSNVDVLGNPLPLPSSPLALRVNTNTGMLSGIIPEIRGGGGGGGARRPSSNSNSRHNSSAIIINEAGGMDLLDPDLEYDFDLDMTNTFDRFKEVDNNNSDLARQSLPPAQKRRRKDTATVTTNTSTTNNGGSNTDGFSSGDEDTGSGNDGSRRRESLVDGKRPERPRLTEEEKKNNHIASEQKRRMAIRDGFDRLTELVPGIEGQGRSESVVLKKTVDHMRKVIEDRRNLIQRVQELGGEVPQELMLR